MTSVAVNDQSATELAELIRVSRTIGSDPALVLHGGGNSSLKTTTTDITGQAVETLYVKGSGHDLATITAAGFAALRLASVRRLLPPVVVPDDALWSELRCALLDADAPDPSVETLVHALLPDPVVLHSHADAVLIISNTVDGSARARSLFGNLCVIVDYAMPGPDLVAACDAAWRARRGDEVGLVVLGHGLFTVGSTPQEALDRHLAVVAVAEVAAGTLPPTPAPEAAESVSPTELARVRGQLCRTAGRAFIVRHDTAADVRAFIADPALLSATERGPLTPDHVSWTKPWPLIGTDVGGYADAYRAYVLQNRSRRALPITELDPAPRVVMDPRLGLLTVGRGTTEAAAVAEITRHTMAAVARAEQLGGYRPASREHVFDLEYWLFQQRKLTRASRGDSDLTGQVALVTGAASGIGRGCAAQLLEAGATVVGWDLATSVTETFDSPNYLGIQLDVTDAAAVAEALAQQIDAFGGLDILVVAAGIFPTSANLGELTAAAWRRTMAVNVDAVMELYGQAMPLLAEAFPYGRVVLIASKNVAAPGPGAAAYSSSKAAVTQLTRVAALEWAGLGIRVNMLHPDAVFDTGLWTPELLAARAEHYGMSIDDYKRRNLLHAEITSGAVGRLATQLCTEDFACTTGAQIPIDGGNERVI